MTLGKYRAKLLAENGNKWVQSAALVEKGGRKKPSSKQEVKYTFLIL